jgi:transcriptional regulator with XRE-family HTH domain
MIDDDYAPTVYDPAQICERIDEMLHALQWSWAELAKKSGVSERTFHRWRNGETIPQTGGVRGAAEAMGLTYEEITHGLRRRTDEEGWPPPEREPRRAPRDAYDPWKVAEDEVFVGREGILRSLTAALEQRRSVNVVGDRRIGKSSILKAWERRARTQGQVVVSASGELTSGRSARALVKAITRADPPDDPDGAADALFSWARSRRRHGPPPLVVVDEFDDLAAHLDNRFFQRLRGLIGEEMATLVLVTRVPLAELGPAGHTSPFDNLLATEPIGLLDPPAADVLVNLRPDTFSTGEVELIRSWSGRHPFYLKLLAHHLLKARREDRPASSAVESFLGDAGRELGKLWRSHLDPEEQAALRAAARGDEAPPRLLRALCRRGVLTENGKPFGRVLFHWLEERDGGLGAQPVEPTGGAQPALPIDAAVAIRQRRR